MTGRSISRTSASAVGRSRAAGLPSRLFRPNFNPSNEKTGSLPGGPLVPVFDLVSWWSCAATADSGDQSSGAPFADHKEKSDANCSAFGCRSSSPCYGWASVRPCGPSATIEGKGRDGLCRTHNDDPGDPDVVCRDHLVGGTDLVRRADQLLCHGLCGGAGRRGATDLLQHGLCQDRALRPSSVGGGAARSRPIPRPTCPRPTMSPRPIIRPGRTSPTVLVDPLVRTSSYVASADCPCPERVASAASPRSRPSGATTAPRIGDGSKTLRSEADEPAMPSDVEPVPPEEPAASANSAGDAASGNAQGGSTSAARPAACLPRSLQNSRSPAPRHSNREPGRRHQAKTPKTTQLDLPRGGSTKPAAFRDRGTPDRIRPECDQPRTPAAPPVAPDR